MPADKYTAVGGGMPSHGRGLDPIAKAQLRKELEKDGTEETVVGSFADLQRSGIPDEKTKK